MNKRTVQVVDYDPGWNKKFALEQKRLLEVMGANAIAIDHIGSTAVEGLCAKPIIDLLMEVKSLTQLDESSHRLTELGYKVKGEYGIPGRRYFQKGGVHRSHHVHAYVSGDQNLARHRAFRDYLISRPAAREEYASIKRRAAAKYRDNPQRYQRAKAAFIEQHEELAVNALGN